MSFLKALAALLFVTVASMPGTATSAGSSAPNMSIAQAAPGSECDCVFWRDMCVHGSDDTVAAKERCVSRYNACLKKCTKK